MGTPRIVDIDGKTIVLSNGKRITFKNDKELKRFKNIISKSVAVPVDDLLQIYS